MIQSSSLDDVEIVFDDDDGIAAIAQAMQYAEQLFDVMEVQAGRRLVEDIQRVTRVAFRQFFRKLDALCFTA